MKQESFAFRRERFKKYTALSLGLGSFGYSIFWLFVGLLTPELGSTVEAKAALELLAIPSVGLCIVGLILSVFAMVKSLFLKQLQ